MNILKHILYQPFIAATGAAAMVHSTWALATLFGGNQPDGWQLVGWLTPALLIAFALDVGQIATSYEIRTYGLTWQRGVTFGVFAAATYYLQWLYATHHMPALALAAGVRGSWQPFATVMRDAAVWIIPMLLPLSTLLYTFSRHRNALQAASTPAANTLAPATAMTTPGAPAAIVEVKPVPALEAAANLAPSEPPAPAQLALPEHTALCPACGWTKGYADEATAARALRVHQSRHCAATHERAMNGAHNG